MGVGAGLYMCDVVKKSSRSLSHLLMSSCLYLLYFPSYGVINDVIMRDADCTPGHEPRSVAASVTLFSRVTLIRKLQSTSDLDHFHARDLPSSRVKSRDYLVSDCRGDSAVPYFFIYIYIDIAQQRSVSINGTIDRWQLQHEGKDMCSYSRQRGRNCK